MKKILASVLMLCLLFSIAACGTQTEPNDNPPAETGAAELSPAAAPDGDADPDEFESAGEQSLLETYNYDMDISQVKGTSEFAVLSGSWYDMGTQYGAQAKDYLVRKIVEALGGAIDSRGSLDTAYSQLQSYEDDLSAYFPEYLDFLKGISDETGYPYQDVLLAHITLDMSWTGDDDSHQCSATAAWGDSTENGHLLAAINADGNPGNQSAPIIIAYPEGGNAFVCGGNSAMNDKGLLVMATQGQSAGEGDVAQGTPITLATIYLTMKYQSAAEALDAYLKNCPPSGGENAVIVDTSGDNYIVEGTPAHHAVRSSGDFGEENYLVVNNHFITDEMQSSLFTDDSYIDCPYRYATVEQILKDNLGHITVDVLRQAEASTRFFDYESGQWVDEWNLGTGLWSPENKHPHYFTYLRRVMDVDDLTVYCLNGSENTVVTHTPDPIGTYCKIMLLENPRTVLDQAVMDLEMESWTAARDVDTSGEKDGQRMEKLSAAREQMIVGKNYYNQALIAENNNDAMNLFAKALTAICEGHCYAKAAQNDPTTF